MSCAESYKEFLDHARSVMINKGVEVTGDLSVRSFVISEMGIKFIPRLINITMDECVQVCTLYEDGYTTCKRGLSITLINTANFSKIFIPKQLMITKKSIYSLIN